MARALVVSSTAGHAVLTIPAVANQWQVIEHITCCYSVNITGKDIGPGRIHIKDGSTVIFDMYLHETMPCEQYVGIQTSPNSVVEIKVYGLPLATCHVNVGYTTYAS